MLSLAGVNAIGVPKTIDNDVWGTDQSFGFDSALTIATDAIDRLHTTANSHRRVMVVELMGHSAGWLALCAGVAGGGDVILIPEIAWKEEVVADYLLQRAKDGRAYSIVVVAEGIALPAEARKARASAGNWVTQRVTATTGFEARETVLGYIQRGHTQLAATASWPRAWARRRPPLSRPAGTAGWWRSEALGSRASLSRRRPGS